VRWPAWSPDSKKVVYGRETSPPPGAPRKLWSKNPHYELFSTRILLAYDRNGERYLATAIAANRRDTTLLLGTGDTPPKPLLESKDELIIAPQWSPRGDAVIFGIGKFASFLDFAIGAKSRSIRSMAAHRLGSSTSMDQVFARSRRAQTTTGSPRTRRTASASSIGPWAPKATVCGS